MRSKKLIIGSVVVALIAASYASGNDDPFGKSFTPSPSNVIDGITIDDVVEKIRASGMPVIYEKRNGPPLLIDSKSLPEELGELVQLLRQAKDITVSTERGSVNIRPNLNGPDEKSLLNKIAPQVSWEHDIPLQEALDKISRAYNLKLSAVSLQRDPKTVLVSPYSANNESLWVLLSKVLSKLENPNWSAITFAQKDGFGDLILIQIY